ncbi:MAG: hypothetical protein II830_04405 [Alphaproteobacteria bacterium]|nr:hypothetical protein [Alphaproteobacteria bacterium]
MTNIVLLVFVLVAAFMPVTVKAENVPAIVVEQCRKAVAQQIKCFIWYKKIRHLSCTLNDLCRCKRRNK